MSESDRTPAAPDEAAHLSAIIAVQTEIAAAGLDLDAIINLVANRAARLTRAAGAVVEIAEGASMVYRAASGAGNAFVGTSLPIATSLSGLCVRTGQVLRCDDAESDPRVDLAACRRVGVRSMLVVPLMHGGEPVGVLKVFAPEPGQFDTRDINSLQLMAGLIGSAMGHASEHEARQVLLHERTLALEALRRSEERLAEQLNIARRLNAELEQANQRLAEMATTDVLTGLRNRRHFDEVLRDAHIRATRRGESLSVILADVDEFKPYNDTYGHSAGDDVLRLVAAAFRGATRGHELVARVGGEEFAILLIDTDAGPARVVAERLRMAVQASPWPARAVTASFGVATTAAGMASPALLLEQADVALYRSKRDGRNRVTHHDVLAKIDDDGPAGHA
jgi:diguanylate cyclase (GGDEF)-like protein